MPYVIDGSNVLGRRGADLHGDDPKRQLVRLLASFARAKRTRVVCFFDGPEPPSFAKSLGSVSIVFSGATPADDLIVKRVSSGRGWSVVTSDRGCAARVAGRHVNVISTEQFMRELELLERDQPADTEDWAAWFSDPKNRDGF
ncbi:MAG TPA: NYN domain-containing protein [Thermoanaerobaculia bacterium]